MPPHRRNRNTAVERVADKFGGLAPFAEALGLSRWAAHKWNSSGGNIPSRYHRQILALAKKRRVRIKVADLVNV